MSPRNLTAERISVPWFEDGFELARHCVARSAFGYISAPSGRGKTDLGNSAAAKWLKRKLPGAFYVLSSRELKVDRVARDAFKAVTGQELPKPRLTPNEISVLILEHLAKLEAACLFIDGAPQLDQAVFGFHLALLNAAQDQRFRLGLVFTTQQAPFSLWGIAKDPNFCRALSIRKLKPNEVVDVYAQWIPEFRPVQESFYKKDPMARQIAGLLYDETKGNFQRLVSVRGLALDYGVESLLCPKRFCSLMGKSFKEADTLTLTN